MDVLEGFHAAKNILVLLLIYNLTCVMVFSIVYYSVGLKKHFNTPDEMEETFPNCMYYAFAVQTTCMAGEVYPKTTTGRTILSFQLMSAFISTMVLIVPWIKAASKSSAK